MREARPRASPFSRRSDSPCRTASSSSTPRRSRCQTISSSPTTASDADASRYVRPPRTRTARPCPSRVGHATVLDVEGVPALRDAVVHCLHSLFSERAQAYRKMRTGSDGAAMSVVVQRMVDARCAGVMFTADPVTARRDRMIVEAVAGTGSALVGGRVTPDRFTLARDGSPVKSELPGPEPCVHDDELKTLASDALRIEQHVGTPVDCEWAIDREGTIAWLQARPITTLPADPRELDDELNTDDIYSRCNVGEIFPGVATPLSISTVVPRHG